VLQSDNLCGVQKERSSANDKMKKLEEENQRLKKMLESKKGQPQQQGRQKEDTAQQTGPKRKASGGTEAPAKKAKAGKAKDADKPAQKSKQMLFDRKEKDDSNFMKLIRQQGLDNVGSAAEGFKVKSSTQ